MAFKICAIGCGAMATTGHGPSFRRYAQEHPDVELAACCDLDAEKAELYRSRFSFSRAYTDMDEMLRNEKPDAVSLVVPTFLTEKLTIHILEMGIPVILEKPPGMDREQTLRMIDAVQRTGTPNQVSFNRRYMPVIRRFKELRQDLTPQMWQYDFFRVGRKDPDFSTTSIHAIDTLSFVAGVPYKTVEFHYCPNPVQEDLVPGILLHCEFADGQTGRITLAPATGFCAERCTMHGTNEMLYAALPFHSPMGSMDGAGEILLARNEQILIREPQVETDAFISNGFYDANASFFDCIRAGKRPEGDIASGLQAVEIADCIRQKKLEYHWQG